MIKKCKNIERLRKNAYNNAMSLRTRFRMIYKNFIKPLSDRFFAAVLLFAFLPILIICGILIRIKLGSPVFFIQERPGKNGKIFKICKFRTMSNACDKDGKLLPDSMRLSGVGAWIRKASLDELPQLWNVLKGEMSFIGPRPLLPDYLQLYSKKESRRHDVLPGITGLAQVSGRNAISWDDKLRLDVEYVDKMSLSLDVCIAFKTVQKVFLKEGITSAGEVSAAVFKGSKYRAAIYGAGGHANVVGEIAMLCGYDICAVIDKDTSKTLFGLQAQCEEEFVRNTLGIRTIFLGIGHNAIRKQIFERLKADFEFPHLVHPCAILSSTAVVKEGAVVMAHAVLNANAVVGEGAIINTASVIEHDNHIAPFAHISPNATLAGAVRVGECTHVGAGAVVKEGICIADGAVIGAGAVVIYDVGCGEVVVGNPARKISKKAKE